MANDLIPFKEHADRITCTPSAAVTGKQFVSISGDRQADGTYTVAPTGAAGKALGVAAWDCPAGGKVTVVTINSGDIVPVKAGAALTAGGSVQSGAGGVAVVATAGATGLGIAMTGAANGADAQIMLDRHSV